MYFVRGNIETVSWSSQIFMQLLCNFAMQTSELLPHALTTISAIVQGRPRVCSKIVSLFCVYYCDDQLGILPCIATIIVHHIICSLYACQLLTLAVHGRVQLCRGNRHVSGAVS